MNNNDICGCCGCSICTHCGGCHSGVPEVGCTCIRDDDGEHIRTKDEQDEIDAAKETNP